MSASDVIEAEAIAARAQSLVAKGGTPCLHLPRQTLAEARADAAAKALEMARNNPAPSCKWSEQHLTSRHGNFCLMCGCDMPTPHFYPAAKVIDFPPSEIDIAYVWSRL